MEAIITAATIATMFFNVANSTTGDYAYNAEMNEGRVESLCVMNRDGKFLNNKLRYIYSYDELDRLVQKTAMIWNERKMTWEPEYRLDMAYDFEGYSVERREWNRKTGSYGEASERMEYEMILTQVMSVTKYKRDSRTNEMEHMGKFLVMNPQTELLAGLDC